MFNARSVAVAISVNSNGIRTLLANDRSIFFISSKSPLIDGVKKLRILILTNNVFRNSFQKSSSIFKGLNNF